MPDDVSSLHSILPDGETAPKWVMLIPGGTFSGKDGRGPYHLPDAGMVITASMAQGKLVIDENHATDHALRSGIRAPAVGWITSLEEREGAIWGEVDWLESGHSMLSRREYRSFSPVFQHRHDGHITRLLRASLTNAPNLDLPSLHSQEPHRMDFLPAIRAALGLPETADQTAVIAAATAARTQLATHATQFAAIATAAKLDTALAPDAIVTALQTRKAEGGTLEEMVALQSQVLELQTQGKRAAAEAAIDTAIRAGKPIPPASRADFIARHMADPAGTEFWLGTMISLHSGGVPPGPVPEIVAGLDHSDTQIAAMMGISPDAMRKSKEAIAKGVAA